MTTTEDSRSPVGGRIDWTHLCGVAALALAVAVLGLAVSGAVAAQEDQPGEPVSVYGEAEDELGNAAPAGTTVYAIVNGTVEDSITVDESGTFGGPETFEGHLAVNDGAGEEIVFAIESPDGTTALETVDLGGVDEVAEVSLTFPGGSFAQIDVTGNGMNATDTSGDGLLNDVDGDGEFGIFDVQAFFNNFDEPVVQNNLAAFNFNNDDPVEVGIFDVQALFNQLDG